MAIFKRLSKNKSTTSKKSSRKRVTFVQAADENVNQVESFQHYKQELWYSRDEECEFRERDAKLSKLLHYMDTNQLELKSGESPRGLEHRQHEFGEAVAYRRIASLKAVVQAQEEFPYLSRDGRDCIARAYRLLSQQATKSALQRAAMDEQFVVDHVRKTVESNTSSTRVFEQRCIRPSILGRQSARRSVTAIV